MGTFSWPRTGKGTLLRLIRERGVNIREKGQRTRVVVRLAPKRIFSSSICPQAESPVASFWADDCSPSSETPPTPPSRLGPFHPIFERMLAMLLFAIYEEIELRIISPKKTEPYAPGSL
jgi:hypothetical protein